VFPLWASIGGDPISLRSGGVGFFYSPKDSMNSDTPGRTPSLRLRVR